MSEGILGKRVRVDLTVGEIRIGDIGDEMARSSLGGRGYNVLHLYRHLPEQADALGPENILVLSCGLLTGTGVPTASRLHVNALSPLTGILGSSNVGGYAGAWLRSCGVQSIVVSGKSEAPVYLYIDDSGAALCSAGHLWGMDTQACQDRLAADLGDAVAILAIGPAGENGCRFACAVTGRDHAAGRTGMGTVMGSKNLKAIVVARGRQKPRAANPQALKQEIKTYIDRATASADFDTFSRYGGAGYVTWAHEKGFMSTRNYQSREFPDSASLDGRQLAPDIVKKTGCFGCPIKCKADVRFQRGRLQGETATRPEFEPMINLGPRCGLSDIQTLIQLENLCTRLGLDSTSASASIAFAMDLFQNGVLTEADTDGLALAWGSGPAMEALIRRMASGEGIGKVLGQGVRRAAAIIGRGAERFAAHVKGLELTAYHPAAVMGTALGYAISSRGGDYNNVYASLEQRWSPEQAAAAFGTPLAVDGRSCEGKGALVRRAVLVNIVVDCLGMCKVPTLSLVGSFDLHHEAALTAAFTGWSLGPEDLFQVGARVAHAERLFSLRHGLDPQSDMLPEMFFDSRRGGGLDKAEVSRMVRDFYRAIGWDERGVPLPESLAAAGL